MALAYKARATRSMVRHPWQGLERIRGRSDRRRDRRELERFGTSMTDLYEAVPDWPLRLHAALEQPWPCSTADAFEQVWDRVVADLVDAGMRVGMFSYGGWNDGDRAFAEAIWCIITHLRPEHVVETGVAHGLTSRIILEGLERNGHGHLWSIDLPAVDPALHPEIGMAVPDELRARWTYLAGTSRERLPALLAELGQIDVFVHDSLHTGRNQRFELESAWAHVRTGGLAVVDDVDHSLAFRTFVDRTAPGEWLAARHITGGGLWGVAVKGATRAEPAARPPTPQPHRRGRWWNLSEGTRRATLRAIEANPHYRALTRTVSSRTARERRHARIERAVVREIARVTRSLLLDDSRLLQIHAGQGQETLLFRDQLFRPRRPVVYDEADGRDPEAQAATDLAVVDLEAARFPAQDEDFDVVVWNRHVVRLKNVVPALREVHRVLEPGGVLILAVPNLAALHNRVLLAAGSQPTTLHVTEGDHVRGFTARSMRRLVERDLGFRVQQVVGVGLAPLTGAVLPGPFRSLSHTVVWVLRKPGAGLPHDRRSGEDVGDQERVR